MDTLMHTLMLSCRKASELIDKKSMVKLSFKENIQLHLHTSMCAGCKAYQKQSKVLDHLLQKHLRSNDPLGVPQVINNDLKNEIISKL